MINLTYQGSPTRFFANPNGTLSHSDPKMVKFHRVAKLAKKWDEVERKLESLLSGKYSREAYICLLMAKTGIRIGNLDSAEGYVAKVKGHEGELVKTYGATTLLNEHVTFDGSKMILDFVGKKVVDHTIVIEDELLVKYGKIFFDQSNETWLNVEDGDVVKFIKKKIDNRLTPKDFRTFAGNCKAFQIYQKLTEGKPLPEKKGDLSKEIKEIFIETSSFLGNTPGICKSAYISPLFVEFVEGERGSKVAEKETERNAKKVAKEEAWKKMNEERVAKGLPRKYHPRKKRTPKKESK